MRLAAIRLFRTCAHDGRGYVRIAGSRIVTRVLFRAVAAARIMSGRGWRGWNRWPSEPVLRSCSPPARAPACVRRGRRCCTPSPAVAAGARAGRGAGRGRHVDRGRGRSGCRGGRGGSQAHRAEGRDFRPGRAARDGACGARRAIRDRRGTGRRPGHFRRHAADHAADADADARGAGAGRGGRGARLPPGRSRPATAAW